MKHWLTVGVVGCVLVAAGCQKTTTSAPAGTSAAGTSTARYEPPRTDRNDVKKLTLMAANSQTITRGGTDKVMVTINRDNFNDPVKIHFEGLPQGVTVVDKEATIASGSNSINVTLQASADAAIGEHQVKIVAEAPGLPKNEQVFKLTVKEK
jgi:hypothetical protein